MLDLFPFKFTLKFTPNLLSTALRNIIFRTADFADLIDTSFLGESGH